MKSHGIFRLVERLKFDITEHACQNSLITVTVQLRASAKKFALSQLSGTIWMFVKLSNQLTVCDVKSNVKRRRF